MAKRGAPLGNNNGGKSKIWSEAIRRALCRVDADEEGGKRAIERLAESLVQKGLSGDVAALKEIGDRVEGKVAQPIGGTDDLPPIKGIEVNFVSAKKDAL